MSRQPARGAGPQSEVCREPKTAGFLAIGPLGLMAGGPEITSPADAGTGGSPTGPPHPPRPPVARAGGDDPAPKPASGFTSDQLRGGRHPLLSSSDQLPKSCHVKDEVAPHPTRRTVYKVVNKRIPRISRRRSSEAPADPRRSPQITATEALLTAVIPANPRPARSEHDRPVTPEVAGSSPVAPALKVPATWGSMLSGQARPVAPWPKRGPLSEQQSACK
jgi:hypothetical protein